MATGRPCRTRVAPHLHGCSGNEAGHMSLAELDSSMLSRTALNTCSSVQYSVQQWTERACCCITVYLIMLGFGSSVEGENRCSAGILYRHILQHGSKSVVDPRPKETVLWWDSGSPEPALGGKGGGETERSECRKEDLANQLVLRPDSSEAKRDGNQLPGRTRAAPHLLGSNRQGQS